MRICFIFLRFLIDLSSGDGHNYDIFDSRWGFKTKVEINLEDDFDRPGSSPNVDFTQCEFALFSLRFHAFWYSETVPRSQILILAGVLKQKLPTVGNHELENVDISLHVCKKRSWIPLAVRLGTRPFEGPPWRSQKC